MKTRKRDIYACAAVRAGGGGAGAGAGAGAGGGTGAGGMDSILYVDCYTVKYKYNYMT